MRVEVTLFLGSHEPALLDPASGERWTLNHATRVTLAVGFPPHWPDPHPTHWREARSDLEEFIFWWQDLHGELPKVTIELDTWHWAVVDWNALPTFEALADWVDAQEPEVVDFWRGEDLEARVRYFLALPRLRRQIEFTDRNERMILERVETWLA